MLGAARSWDRRSYRAHRRWSRWGTAGGTRTTCWGPSAVPSWWLGGGVAGVAVGHLLRGVGGCDVGEFGHLDADPSGDLVGVKVGPDRFGRATGRELGRDAVAYRTGRARGAGSWVAAGTVARLLGDRGPLAATATVDGRFPSDRGRMTTDATGDHRPRHLRVGDQRDADLLAVEQR